MYTTCFDTCIMSQSNDMRLILHMASDNKHVQQLKEIPILSIADLLGFDVKHNKTYCFQGHDKATPSLSFTPDKNLWYCFGCGLGGSNIDLIMQVNNCSFKDAISWLDINSSSNRATQFKGTTSIPPRRASSINFKAKATIKDTHNYTPDSDVYEWFLNHCKLSDEGLKYLTSRGYKDKIIKRFKIVELNNIDIALDISKRKWGLSRLMNCGLITKRKNTKYGSQYRLAWWDRAILFPFYENGRITYIQGRRLYSNDPKYIGLKGIEKPMFNIDIINNATFGSKVYICEGVTDAISAAQLGFQAVGILGASSFKAEWANEFKDFDVLVVPDRDSGGEKFATSVKYAFKRIGKIINEVDVTPSLDLTDYLTQK